MSAITVDIADGIATITLNRPKSLNAVTKEDYDAFANALRDIDKREDVLITVWQATGRWFCAGTDVKARSPTDTQSTIGNVRNSFKSNVVSTTTDCGKAVRMMSYSRSPPYCRPSFLALFASENSGRKSNFVQA